jgi:hypothetical protein
MTIINGVALLLTQLFFSSHPPTFDCKNIPVSGRLLKRVLALFEFPGNLNLHIIAKSLFEGD